MANFPKLLSSTVIALVCATAFTPASALFTAESHAMRRSIDVGATAPIEAYHPASTFETYASGVDHPLSRSPAFSLKDAALAYAAGHLSVKSDSITYKSGYSGQVAHHAFLTQLHEGIPFANTAANVIFNKENKVASFASSFIIPRSIASPFPSVSLADSISVAEKALNGTFNGHPATLEYLAKSDGTAVLTHVIQVENEPFGSWFEGFVDAHSGDLVSVTDFVSKASYRVLPIRKETLLEGFETLTNPADLTASPQGWHSTGTTNSTSTSGNNAVSYKSSTSATTSQSSSDLNFIFVQDPSLAPTAAVNLDAARVNAFYLVNTIHDITYKYGFTEAAYNFQTNNFGKGGSGNDAVTISVQDSSGTNNANFATGPDGQPGKMRMYLWTKTSPQRDGSLENDIVTHEMTHGVTNRLTGGGTGRCLQTTEAGGMGEGWSDAMADWNEKTSSAVPDFVLGQYVTNNPAGIRTHPYSTSATVNPLRYSDLKTRTEVHSIGEIWANILHNVYAQLVSAKGWSATAKSDPTGTQGNVIFLHLFIDSLAIQPCNPTFVTARDAWIQADVNRYEGANACVLWSAFASRGLGVGAANHVDSTSVPASCQA